MESKLKLYAVAFFFLLENETRPSLTVLSPNGHKRVVQFRKESGGRGLGEIYEKYFRGVEDKLPLPTGAAVRVIEYEFALEDKMGAMPWNEDASYYFALHADLDVSPSEERKSRQIVGTGLVNLKSLIMHADEFVVTELKNYALLDEPGYEEAPEGTKGFLVMKLEAEFPDDEVRFTRLPERLTKETHETLNRVFEAETNAALMAVVGDSRQEKNQSPLVPTLPEASRVFAAFCVGVVRAPVWTFFDLSKVPVVGGEDETLLLYLNMGLKEYGFTPQEFTKVVNAMLSTPNVMDGRSLDALNAVVTACTTLGNALYYTPDFTARLPRFGAKTGFMVVDQFGGDVLDDGNCDCEDSDRLSLVVFCFLRRAANRNLSPVMAVAQRLAACYIPCGVLLSVTGASMDEKDGKRELPQIADQKLQDSVGAHILGVCFSAHNFLEALQRNYNMKQLPAGLLTPQTEYLPHLPNLCLEGTGPMEGVYLPYETIMPEKIGEAWATRRKKAEGRFLNYEMATRAERGDLEGPVALNIPQFINKMRMRRWPDLKETEVNRGVEINEFYRLFCTFFCCDDAEHEVDGNTFTFRQFDAISSIDLDGRRHRNGGYMFRGIPFYDFMNGNNVSTYTFVLAPAPTPLARRVWDNYSKLTNTNSPITLNTVSPEFYNTIEAYTKGLKVAAASIHDPEGKIHHGHGSTPLPIAEFGGPKEVAVLHYYQRYSDLTLSDFRKFLDHAAGSPGVVYVHWEVNILYEKIAQVDLFVLIRLK